MTSPPSKTNDPKETRRSTMSDDGMTPHDALVQARSLLADPEDWGQGAFCENRKRCLAGALISVWRGEDPQPRTAVNWSSAPGIRELETALGGRDVVRFNDTHTHAEVLALLDEAIAATAPAPDMSWLREPERETASA